VPVERRTINGERKRPTTIIAIRHAEKPGNYGGTDYKGVDATATTCGTRGGEHLTTTGWQRAGGLVTLFGPPPFGPRADLAAPDFLYAADPKDAHDKTPSQRPYETVQPLSAVLGRPGAPMKVHTKFSKKDYPKMVTDVLTRSGVVLICWQHEDIPLKAGSQPGISQEILTQTKTEATFPAIPASWPKDAQGEARYDLILVFTRSLETGQIVSFQLLPQYLVSGDGPAPQQTGD
jgi:hypothetical protein